MKDTVKDNRNGKILQDHIPSQLQLRSDRVIFGKILIYDTKSTFHIVLANLVTSRQLEILEDPEVAIKSPVWLFDLHRLCSVSSKWRHNEHYSVANHQLHDCLLNRIFGRRSKKTSKLRVTGLCAGNSPGTGEFPAQRASNAENVSIWWRHHDIGHFSNAFIWCWIIVGQQ